MARLLLILALAFPLAAAAQPLAAPGDLGLRHDLQLLNDARVIDVPLTAWPIAYGDIHNALADADLSESSEQVKLSFARVRERLNWELEVDTFHYRVGLAAAENPRIIRGFEDTPREDGEVSAGLSWFGERLAMNLQVTYVDNPFDGEELRPDGTYLGIALGNWMVTAGWQERWWGPSRDGSLILSTNARATPGIAVQRNVSTPFKTKWLSWMGPWTFTSFMTELDDDRTINNALLFGVRGSIRPPGTGLEIGISRTAQWCGDGRPCDAGTFGDLLIGKDNRGVNVDIEDEPGNQLGGFDIRWRLPREVPVALHLQWIGEDGRGGGGAIGSWLRQVGAEHWGTFLGLSHRTYVEVSETTCREGGFGFGQLKPNCGFEHEVYLTGYRYQGRSLGHPTDGDSRSYSIGSTLVQSGGYIWNAQIRYMEINRVGAENPRHTLTPTPQDLLEVYVSHERMTKYGRFHAGVGFSQIDDKATETSSSDAFGFFQWSSN